MITNGILVSKQGRLQGYMAGSKLKHGKSKAGFVEDGYYFKMIQLQKQQKVDKLFTE